MRYAFLNPESGHRILGDHIIRALFEENPQVRDVSFDQILHPEIGIGL
jgi:hypothetical protein